MKFALAVLLAGAAMAADWGAVQRIPPGSRVNVTTTDGAHAYGVLESANGEAVVVRDKAGQRAIRRAEIRQVGVDDPGRRVRRGLVWSGVGAAAGIGLGAAVCPHCPNEGRPMKFMGPGLAAGAAIGALGFLSSPWRTVYRSQ